MANSPLATNLDALDFARGEELTETEMDETFLDPEEDYSDLEVAVCARCQQELFPQPSWWRRWFPFLAR